jgi:hypothetical protein
VYNTSTPVKCIIDGHHQFRGNNKVAMEVNRVLATATKKLLKPLVRILLRHGISQGTFAELAKYAYVEVAMKEFGLKGKGQSISRASILTGLSRKEVAKLVKSAMKEDIPERYNRAVRVMTGWLQDKRFTDKNGAPLVLPIEAKSPSFSELVKLYSGDLTPGSVLDELTRVGSVRLVKGGKVRLISRGYVPYKGSSEKLEMLGIDVAEFISTIDHNHTCKPEEAFYQRKVWYDNLPEEAIPLLRKLVAKEAQKVLELLNKWMAKSDRDTNKSIKGTGRKYASLGVYYHERDFKSE